MRCFPRRLYALSAFALLFSCSSSAPVDGGAYFDAFLAGGKETFAGESVSLTCSSGALNLGFEGESGSFDLTMSRLNFDLRLSGLTATKAEEVKASFTPVSKSGNKVTVSGSGVPSAMSGFIGGGISTNVSLDLDEGVAYANLSDASVLRLALQTAVRDAAEDPEFSLPQRSKTTFDQKALSSLEEGLPLKDGLQTMVEDWTKEMRKAYETSPADFAFDDAQGEKTIIYHAKAWDSLRRVVEAFDLGVETSAFDVSSAFDRIEEEAELKRLNISYVFSDSGLRSASYDVAFAFKGDSSSQKTKPTGEWSMNFALSFAKDKAPLTLTATEKSKYQELEIPEFPQE